MTVFMASTSVYQAYSNSDMVMAEVIPVASICLWL